MSDCISEAVLGQRQQNEKLLELVRGSLSLNAMLIDELAKVSADPSHQGYVSTLRDAVVRMQTCLAEGAI